MKKLSKLMALLLALVLVFGTVAGAVAEGIQTVDEYLQTADEQLHTTIMAYDNYPDYWDMAKLIDEQDFIKFFSGLTTDEQNEMATYMEGLFWDSLVAFTNVAPFVDSISVADDAAATRGLMSLATKEETTENGLILSKTATPTGTGTYQIQLEAYVTGTVTTETVTTSKPCDIVLVLDFSNSMSQSFDGSGSGGQGPGSSSSSDSKIVALQTAVNNFIQSVNDQYDATTANHRISLVSYNSTAVVRNEWTEVSDANVSGLQISDTERTSWQGQGTNTHLGLASALTQLNSAGTSTDRQRVVVLFTDGVPGTSQGDFDESAAVSAVTNAKSIKDTGATVYSVAVLSGADPTAEIDTSATTDTTKINAMLHAISSNYPSATASASGSTFNVTLGTGSNAGYYVTADSATSLNNIFQQISSNIQSGSASMQLGSSTVVQDIVAPSFTMPANASDITVQTVECLSYTNGTPTWSTEKETLQGATIVPDASNNSISVNGFDFQNNFVSENGYAEGNPDGEGTYHGKKLVITFTVKTKAGFLGGNDVPTNGTESAVYSADGTKVEAFAVPTVDMTPKTPTVDVVDKNVYLLSTLTQDQLIKDATVTVYDIYGTAYPLDLRATDDDGNAVINFGLEEYATAYVDLSVTKPAAVTTPLEQDSTFSLSCTLTPTGVTGTAVTDTANINVFKPVLTFEDGIIDYNTALYDDATFNSTTDDTKGGYVSVVWKHGDTIAPDAMGAAPDLTKSYEALAGVTDGIVTALEEVPMKVTVKIGSTDVTAHTTIYRDACDIVGEVSGKECAWSALAVAENTVEKPAFVLHVINTVGDLKISKEVVYDTVNSKIPNANDTFTFEVTLGDDATATYSYQIFNVGEETDTAAGDAQTMTGTTVEITLKDGQYVLFSDVMCDTAYTVEELALPTDYTLESTSNNLTGSIEPAETIEVEFVNRYHKLGSLTISKTGLNQYIYTDGSDNESAIFTVTGPNGESWTVVLTGNKSVTIDNLLAGAYTVHEESGWTWRYKALADQTATIEHGSDETVEFENVHENQSWLGGDNYDTNVFN